MNRFTILIAIFFVFASFATSIPLKRHGDPLSGFEQCSGHFPNHITKFKFFPDPALANHNVSIRIAGEASEIIELGAVVVFTGFLDDKEVFHVIYDFCLFFVAQSGYSCPVGKGHFDFTATWDDTSSPTDPKNTVIEYKLITESA